ncbi:MAG TPA: hypothetical protein VFZ79_18205 [Acidimicrobiales bacterium]
MHPTRSIPLLRRALAVAAVPALLLTAAACSDGDDDGDDAASFCDRFEEIDERYSGIEDPTDEDFDAAIDAVADLDPPAEIEEDWNTMIEAFRSFSEIDVSDPEALADVDFTEAEAASDRVDAFLAEECGIEN